MSLDRAGRWKFIVGPLVIVGALVYFAVLGFNEGKAYYVTVEEFHSMGADARGKTMKVAGTVVDGSIQTGQNGRLTFELAGEKQEDLRVQVTYTGRNPVPDTFGDGSMAVIQGRYEGDRVFYADHIQAKCASKYEAKYEEMAGRPASVQ
jgi:cytochrome c-type biogenesis protein CcmE